ncbi:MAG: tetratricopeptide repeat protein [Candidatus Omnitrophica bacterium]|nr:tetratricopeptide repeat protein [Candidatus Omnitrophota bacterium]
MAKIKQSILISYIVLLYAATLPPAASFNKSFLENKKEPDILQNMFGGMRSFVSDWAFMKAEEYHHRGLPFKGAAAYHEGKSTLMAEEALGAGTHEHHHAESGEKTDIFSRVQALVKVTEDSHLTPSQEKEVLPWFYTEVMFNPHDIRGYVLGGYWLGSMGRYEESLKFLKEGQMNNPNSAQILTSIAKLYYRNNRYENAVSCLERSRVLWLKAAPPNLITNQYMEGDRLETFDLLGNLYEKQERYEKALEAYSQLLTFGQLPAVEKKIIRLKNMTKAVK